jgi:hypothetical protein
MGPDETIDSYLPHGERFYLILTRARMVIRDNRKDCNKLQKCERVGDKIERFVTC